MGYTQGVTHNTVITGVGTGVLQGFRVEMAPLHEALK